MESCYSLETVIPVKNTDASYLRGVQIAVTAPTNSQLLTYNSGTNLWEPQILITRVSGTKEFWIDTSAGNNSNDGQTSGTPVQTWPVLMSIMKTFSYDTGIINLTAGQSIVDEFSTVNTNLWSINSKTVSSSWDFTPVGFLYERIIVRGESTVNITITPGSTANYSPFISTINTYARYNYTDVSVVTGSDTAGIYIPSTDKYQTTNNATSTSTSLFTAQSNAGALVSHYVYGINSTATSIAPSVATAIVSPIPVYFERIKFNGSTQSILFIGPNFTFRGSYVDITGFNNLGGNVMVIACNVAAAGDSSTFTGTFNECIFPLTCTLSQGCNIKTYDTIFNTLTTAQSSPSDNGIILSTWDSEVNTLSNFRNGYLYLHHMGLNSAVMNTSNGSFTDCTVRGQFTVDLGSIITMTGGEINLSSGGVLVNRGSKLSLLMLATVKDNAGSLSTPIINIDHSSQMYTVTDLSFTSSVRSSTRILIQRMSSLHTDATIDIGTAGVIPISITYGSQISALSITGDVSFSSIPIVGFRHRSSAYVNTITNTGSGFLLIIVDIQLGTSAAIVFVRTLTYSSVGLTDELCVISRLL